MKISPFHYTDYRKFLGDFFKENAISYRDICMQTGIKSRGHLSLILHGKVNISLEQIRKIAQCCNLKKRETDFFATMVRFNQEKNTEKKIRLFEELISFRESLIYRLKPHSYKYFDKWYHSVMRALLEFIDVKDDATMIAKMVIPAIRPDQARNSLKVLAELGLIAPDANGHWRPTRKSIDTGSSESSVMINNFVLSMLDRAREAMNRFPREQRLYSCVTLSVNKEGYNELLAELREFRRRSAEIAQKHPADHVVQVNFQMFPVSKKAAQRGPAYE
ncbi:MAG: TIGR02147 family protein [Chitinivibrionales bacterium]